jgi:para-aminobenzoate synthetase component 1
VVGPAVASGPVAAGDGSSQFSQKFAEKRPADVHRTNSAFIRGPFFCELLRETPNLCPMNRRQAAIERMNELGRRREPFLFLVDFEEQTPLLFPLSELDPTSLWYDFGGVTNAPAAVTAPTAFDWRISPPPFADFQTAFDRVQRELRAGNTFLLNLTTRTRVETNLSLQTIFHASRARYKVWLAPQPPKGAFQPEKKMPPLGVGGLSAFVCFSPEPFVRVEGNRIATFPMKGTLRADEPDARARLLANPKEEAEHYTIVDLLRNDLSQVARRVRVTRFRYVEEVPTHAGPLLQASSEISGDLPPTWPDTLGAWFFRLLPAGSVSGAPKKKTVEIIQTAEGQPRGFYTGVAGLFDGKSLDSGVLIRFLEETPEGLFFRSGGGITFRSEVQAEYRELLDKVYVPIPRNDSLP